MILVITDLHGHVHGLERAIKKASSLTNKPITQIVLLGDYSDNGPHVPQLIEKLIEYSKDDRFHFIMGNHDLMNIYNLGLGSKFNVNCDVSKFNKEWMHYFNDHNFESCTPVQYDATDIKKYPSSVPQHHKDFLTSLPMYYKTGNYVFIHAGLTEENAEKQFDFLNARDMSKLPFPFIPPQMKRKNLWNKEHESGYIVVSGHCKQFANKNFISPKRIGFHSGTCQRDHLECALLPENALSVDIENSIFFRVETERSGDEKMFDTTNKKCLDMDMSVIYHSLFDEYPKHNSLTKIRKIKNDQHEHKNNKQKSCSLM